MNRMQPARAAPKTAPAEETPSKAPEPVAAGSRDSDWRSDVHGVRFSAYLKALAAEIRKSRSGEKTRLRLMSSGVALLEKVGFRELQVEDVSKDAGLAKGTFYIYFKTKEDFLIELGRRYVHFERATVPIPIINVDPIVKIRHWVEWNVKTFSLNVGIIRCLVQMGEVSAEMRDLWHQRNRYLVDLGCISFGADASIVDPHLSRLVLRLSGAMVDHNLFERYHIHIGPGTENLDDSDLMTELYVLLIFRAVYGCNPPEAELSKTRGLLHWPNEA